MKTSYKSEIKDFAVTGVKTHPGRNGHPGLRVEVAFSANAKGRLVAWNNITGSVLVPVALVAKKGFGPEDISFRDFSWHVHIMRGGKEVTRGMKPTPRKQAINHALVNLLAPALLGADTDPDRPFVNEKAPAPKVAPKRTRKSKEDPGLVPGLVEGLEAVGLNVLTEVPKDLEMPEFLKR